MMKTLFKLAMVTASSVLLVSQAFSASAVDDLDTLMRKIEALQLRITDLEARQTFTSFMPDFSERFHVMHRAGEAEDWAVASHELAEMQRLAALSTSIDAEKGALMQAMMGPSFDALNQAIEHADLTAFEKTLSQTVMTCNACHSATGSEFIQITLDGRDAMSLRHPHAFSQRSVPGEHGHGMPSGQTNRMMSSEDNDAEHDETDSSAHTD